MAKLQTLKVWPNPFHALDHEGVPCALLPYEPEGDGVTTFDDRRFVGAHLQAKITQTFQRGDARHAIQRTSVKYTNEEVTVRNTAYYAHAILRGEIFAADEASAKAVGIQKFLPPGEGLQLEKEAAIGLWERAAHEEHDGVPEVLRSFVFGPMAGAKEALAAEDSDDNQPTVGGE